MERQKNMLYRVASENENTITEIFANLMRWKYVRDILLKRMHVNEFIDKIEYKNITTQVTILNQKRPDIVIENEYITLFIENKIFINTQLQYSQCNDYYKELSGKIQANRRMIFIVPENYNHEKIIKDNSVNYPSVQTCIIHWNDIVDDIMKSDIYDGSSIIKENIEFIINVLSLRILKKTYTIREAIFMFDSYTIQSVSSLLLKTQKYISEVMEQVFKKYKTKYGFLKTIYEHNENNIGAWIVPDRNRTWVLFLGYNFTIEDSKYLLNFRIHNSIIKTINENSSFEYIIVKEWYVFAIPKDILANEKNVPNELYSYVERVIEEFC